ncbi:MAG: outer membrane lipoprotein-sorting protein [Acidobacteria bacterium]|nr:outer membrane lipoprotein-sorting protein [Acidobacteriota bacterium]
MSTRIVFALIAGLCPAAMYAQDKLTAAEIIDRAQAAYYSPGSDMKARVVMELINADGKKRTRVLTMLRKSIPGGREQRYFLYFHEPGDVRRTAFLVWKYPEKDDDRWIFIPAVNMTRRIAARDSRSSFVGSDFSYEDVSGRDVGADSHALLREERLGDSSCYVVQSTPKAAADFSRKLSWIDKTSWLPLKEEYYDAQNQLARLFTAGKVETIDAGGKTYPTVVKRTMKNVQSGHRTEVVFESITYDVGIAADVFTERSLQQAPEKWIR